MKKIDPENYRGIKYVEIQNLPVSQQELIKEWLREDQLIKIVRKGILLENCIQYDIYLKWFNTMHNQEVTENEYDDNDDKKNIQPKRRSKNQKEDLLLRIWPFSSLSLKS